MKRLTTLFIAITLISSIILTGCGKKNKPVEVAKPELTEEQAATAKNIDITLKRYEQDLFNIDQKNMKAAFAAMYGKYPENIIANGAWENQEMIQAMREFINDPVIQGIYKETETQYADMSDFEKEISPALTLYLTHFPGERIPEFCTLVAGIDFQMPQVFGYANTIFICLDMYLGPDCRLYAQAGMPKYIAARCDKKYMATDCFSKALVYKHLPEKTPITLLTAWWRPARRCCSPRRCSQTRPRRTSSATARSSTSGLSDTSRPSGTSLSRRTWSMTRATTWRAG